MAGVVEEHEVLSSHATLSSYRGTERRPCRFRTSECPENCGHGSVLAIFDVQEYTEYQRLGEYGDEKAATHFVLLQGGGGHEAPATPEQAAFVASLAPGELVRLIWRHDYVTRTEPGGGVAKFPRRPLVLLERAH